MTETNMDNSRNSSFNENNLPAVRIPKRNGVKGLSNEGKEIANFGIDNAAFTADDENVIDAVETTPLSPKDEVLRSNSVGIKEHKGRKQHIIARRTRSEAVSDLTRDDALSPVEALADKDAHVFSPMHSPLQSPANSVAPSPIHSAIHSPAVSARPSPVGSVVHTPVVSAHPSPIQTPLPSPGQSPVSTSFGIELNTFDRKKLSIGLTPPIAKRTSSLDRKVSISSTVSQPALNISNEAQPAVQRIPNQLKRMSAIRDDAIVAVPLQNDSGFDGATSSGQNQSPSALNSSKNNGNLNTICPNSTEMRKRQVSIAIPEDHEIRDFQRRRSERKSIVGTKVEVRLPDLSF